jgi:hypothetical protein
MKPSLPRTLSAVPQTLHARLEIAKAIRTLAGPDEDELLRQRRTEIAAIRRDLEALPGEIRKAGEEFLALAKAELRAALKKCSPDQPRVPTGNPDGGQWTSAGGNGSSTDSSDVAGVGSESPKRYAALDTGTLTDETKGGGSTASADTSSSDGRAELAQLKVTPEGFSISRPPGKDPLDPKGLNGPISPDEQQNVADALTLILNQDFGAVHPHVYKNYPHPETGAVLPSSTAGYIAFDVPGLGAGRGVGRLVIDAATAAIYYTNNHYLSFYPLKLNPRGE